MLQKLNSSKKGNVFYLRASGGALVHSVNGNCCLYSTVRGRLEKIFVEEYELGGERKKSWHVRLSDGSEVYEVVFPLHAESFVHFVRCLCSRAGLASLDNIGIRAYLAKEKYTNISVYGGHELLRYDDGPRFDGGGETLGSSDRLCQVQDLVDIINGHIRTGVSASQEREWEER